MARDDDARPGFDRYGHRIDERATLGLLEYVSSHTVDEDYAFVHERRDEEPQRRRIGLVGAAVLALFALVAVTAFVQTSRNAVSAAEERDALVTQVTAARTRLAEQRNQLSALREETTRAGTAQLSGDQSSQQVLDRVTRLGILAGTVPVRGPGVRVLVDDAQGATSAREQVLDTDLQRLANGFWEAGAEGIALNGQRLTALSAIRLAGSAITVNNRSLRRPYVMTVIGDKDTLPARFAETSSGQAWLDLKREVGLQLSITPADSLRLPAAEVLGLRYANRKAGDAS